MSIYSHTPYTYLIGWSKLNTWYYGVRYAKDCHPDDLWNPYTTSSKYVDEFREKHGEPDVIQVRRIFKNSKAATAWEEKVIRRLGAIYSDKWLNLNAAGAIYNSPEKYIEIHNKVRETKKKNPQKAWNKGLTKETDIRLQKLSETVIKTKSLNPPTIPWNKGISKHIDKRLQATSEKLSNVPKSDDHKAKLSVSNSGYTWYTDGVISIQIWPEDDIPEGFYKGQTKKIKKRSWFTDGIKSILLTKNDIVPEGFYPGHSVKRDKKYWFTDGIKNILLSKEDEVPKGFYKGQIKSKYTVSDKHGNGGKSQKGQMWYNDGIRNFKFYPDEAPEGLGKGKLPTKRK